MPRGRLRIYLGAAPGVGKTVAMLEEAHRRLTRGTDVVVGLVETHGRRHTAERVDGLEVLPRLMVTYRGAEFSELDVAGVLRRAPQVVLVDELAHTNIPGLERAKRWQDVHALLDAGIDVISTVNVQHLESLNDVVEAITGVTQRETVPDAIVRAAEQIELVDMTPEALRRRLAHGNIYPAERIDAALGSYFRPGNITALRELALLWLADSVEDGLQRYREQHGIAATWETRERIVIGLTGGPEGEPLIRRAARIAARVSGADLLAVHIARSDGLAGSSIAELDAQRLLVESFGGSYHSIIGEDIPRTLLDFARQVDATQIVLGAARHRPWTRVLRGSDTGATVGRLSGLIDVHVVGHAHAGPSPTLPTLHGGLTARRQLAGLACAAVLLGAGTPALTALRHHLSFASEVCIYLLVVIITSMIGGFYPALATALVASLLINYYFAPPIHTLTIAEGDNVLALAIFVLIAVLVSRVVDLAARRLVVAARASAEAETLSTLAGSLLRGEQALPALLQRVQETFGMRSVSLLRRVVPAEPRQPGWEVLASEGSDAPMTPEDADCVAEIDSDQMLAASGRVLGRDDRRVLAAFAAQVAVAYRQRELAAAARALEPLTESERVRTALLNAVGHDLRTPIAAAKTAVSSLRAADIVWTDDDRVELLETADDALDRLTDLVTNLLDLTRLEAGVLPLLMAPVALEDVVARALDHVVVETADSRAGPDRTSRIVVSLPVDLSDVNADAGLLERVIANLVQNALRYSPPSAPVSLTASSLADRVELRIVDRGPGIAPGDTERVFAPFQRSDDVRAAGTGVGLGLAIARGFTEAMGGTVTAEQTPGGGATLVVGLHASEPATPEET
jgi:two-component system, OmpR family, sensor histidine kinase KdpD